GGNNILVTNNEIYNNGRGGVDPGWDAGGAKFVATLGLTFRGNNSHNNTRAGGWTDGDNNQTIYENNLLTQNDGPRIFHQISHHVTIRNNTIKDNGSLTDTGWLWTAGIQISTSDNAEIYGNLIEVNSMKYTHGIAFIQQNRGSGPLGPYRT